MFDSLVNEYNNIKAELTEKVKNSLSALFQEVFERYPEITVIKWTQYTPYFNDGDTCEFYVNEFYVSNIDNPERMTSWGEFEDLDAEEKYFRWRFYTF